MIPSNIHQHTQDCDRIVEEHPGRWHDSYENCMDSYYTDDRLYFISQGMEMDDVDRRASRPELCNALTR